MKNKRFKEVDKEFVEGLFSYFDSLKNMDIETAETKILEFTELLAKSSKEQLKKALKEAYKTGYMTKKEYEKEWKGRYYCKESGIDGFATILYVALYGKKENPNQPLIIVTTDKNEIKDADKIKKRFGMQVINPKEATKMVKKSIKEDHNKIVRR